MFFSDLFFPEKRFEQQKRSKTRMECPDVKSPAINATVITFYEDMLGCA